MVCESLLCPVKKSTGLLSCHAPTTPGALLAVVSDSYDLDTAVTRLWGGSLRDELIARGGPYAASLARGRAVRMALDQVLSDESAALVEGAEVAFFPPVTGG